MGDSSCFSWEHCRKCLSNTACDWYLANNGTYECILSRASTSFRRDYSYYHQIQDCPDRILYSVVLKQLDELKSGANPNWSWITSMCIIVVVAVVFFFIGARYGQLRKRPAGPESLQMRS